MYEYICVSTVSIDTKYNVMRVHTTSTWLQVDELPKKNNNTSTCAVIIGYCECCYHISTNWLPIYEHTA